MFKPSDTQLWNVAAGSSQTLYGEKQLL